MNAKFRKPGAVGAAALLSVATLLVSGLLSCSDSGSSPVSPLPLPDTASKHDTAKDTSKHDTGKVVPTDTTKPRVRDTIPSKISDTLRRSPDTLSLHLAAKGDANGVATTLVYFDAVAGTTYHLAAIPSGYCQIQVIAVAPDSTRQVTTPFGGDHVDFPCTRSGKYLARLRGPVGAVVKLGMTSQPGLPANWIGTDTFEFDGDQAHAKPIDATKGVQIHTLPANGTLDTDWVRFSMDSGRTYDVSVAGITGGDTLKGQPRVDVFGADGKPLRTLGTESVFRFGTIARQDVFLRLRAATKAAGTYSVSVSSVAGLPARTLPPDAYEPDSTEASAKSIGFDSVGQSRTLHGDSLTTDVDFVAIQADSGSTYTIQFPSNRGLSLSMRSPLGGAQALFGEKDTAGFHVARLQCVKSGRYVARISGTKAVAYDLRVLKSAGIPAWSPVPDAYEPDDSPATAVSIKPADTGFVRTLTPLDADWFRIEADSGMQWRGSIAFPTNMSDRYIAFQMFDQDMVQFDSARISYINQPMVVARYFKRHESVYIKVSRFPTDTVVTENYKLSTSLSKGQDPYEPDASPSLAIPFPWDSSAVARTLEPRDTDWFALRIPAGRTAHVEFPGNQTHDPVYSNICDPAGVSFKGYPYESGFTMGVSTPDFVLFAPRDTVLLMNVFSPSLKTTYPYVLRGYLTTDALDSLEPDETKAAARTIRTDSVAVARDLRNGDQDWMTFPVAKGRVYTVSWRGLRPTGILGTSGADLLATSNDSTQSFLARADGDFTIHYAATSYLTGVQKYTVRVSSQAYPDALEPDETLHGAVLLALDSVDRSRASMPGDDDWMRIPPGGAGQPRYVRVGLPAGSDFGYEIRRRDSVLVGSYAAGSPAKDVMVAGPLDTATYFLHVLPSKKTWSSYSVRAWAEANPDTFEAHDTYAAAPILVSGGVLTRSFYQNDTDLVRISLEAGTAVRVTDDAGVVIYQIPSEAGSAPLYLTRGVLRSPVQATYVLRLAAPTMASPYLRYSVQATPIPFDTSSYHSSLASAVPVPADGSVSAVSDAYLTSIFERIPFKAGVPYSVVARSPGIYLELLRQDSTRVVYQKDSILAGYLFPVDTSLYLRATGANENAMDTLNTVSTKVFRMPNDAAEPDTDTATIETLVPGVAVSRLLPQGDTDMVSTPVQHYPTPSCVVNFGLTTGRIHAEAVDDGRGSYSSFDGAPGASTWRIAGANGKLYIKIWSNDRTSKASIPYTITLTNP